MWGEVDLQVSSIDLQENITLYRQSYRPFAVRIVMDELLPSEMREGRR